MYLTCAKKARNGVGTWMDPFDRNAHRLLTNALGLTHNIALSGKSSDSKTATALNSNGYVSLLQLCTHIKTLKQIHAHMLRNGFHQSIFLENKLVNMYAIYGTMQTARLLFDRINERNVFVWNVMIRGYATSGPCEEALHLYRLMQQNYIEPNDFTFTFVLKACAQLSALQEGQEVHDEILRTGLQPSVFVGNALVAMYSKCGSLNVARQVFDEMSERDVVSWNTMIAGYAQNGHANQALTLFKEMQLAGMTPDSVTMKSVLPACAHLAALQPGQWVHGYIIRTGFESVVAVGNALIDMYAKCGSLGIARQVFDKMPKRNVVSWSAMIAGYGMHGHGEDALVLFAQMQHSNVKPDDVTFICLLSACGHGGLVDEGWQYFDCMTRDYCITARVEHYACMVDLLGRAGRLDEALEFIEKMPLKPDAGVWGALLGACRVHCNVKLGELVARRILGLDPGNAGRYIQLSNIYAAAGRWEDVAKVRAMMKERGLKKPPGQSLIEVNNRVNAFLTNDRSHPQSEKIYAVLEALAGHMEEAGYVPDISFVLCNLEEEAKEYELCSHSV